MKKSLIVKINDGNEYIAPYGENLGAWVSIQNNPNFKEHQTSEFQIQISGMEWGENCSALDYGEFDIQEQDKITISYNNTKETNLNPVITKLDSIKTCSFCHKTHKEVEYLFENDSFNKICNECVETCMVDLTKRRKASKK